MTESTIAVCHSDTPSSLGGSFARPGPKRRAWSTISFGAPSAPIFSSRFLTKPQSPRCLRPLYQHGRLYQNAQHCTEVWTMSTPLLAGQTITRHSPRALGSSSSRKKYRKKLPSGHVITTTRDMNKCKANHGHQKPARKETRMTPDPSRRRAH